MVLVKFTGFEASPRGLRAVVTLGVLLLLSALVTACASPFDASTSTRFDAGSDKAIVLVGTSVSRVQDDGAGTARRLETYWQEYDPSAQRLRPDGESFLTRLSAGSVAEPGYLIPTVSVLEVDPGDYALIGAGFPHLMTLYVRSKGALTRSDRLGNYQSWTHTVDPRRHVNPTAPVNPGQHLVFSVSAGQIVYIGHLRFQKLERIDNLVSIDYSHDEAAARQALARIPGISGTMITLDLRRPAQSVSR